MKEAALSCGMERVLGSDGDTYEMGMPLEAVTMAEYLGEAGYAVGITGKWHLGETTDLAADHPEILQVMVSVQP